MIKGFRLLPEKYVEGLADYPGFVLYFQVTIFRIKTTGYGFISQYPFCGILSSEKFIHRLHPVVYMQLLVNIIYMLAYGFRA